MKFVLALAIVLILANSAFAGKPITVRDTPFLAIVPTGSWKTAEEYREWAEAENARAEEQAHRRAAEYRQARAERGEDPISRRTHVVQTNGSSRRRAGGGYGAGGFGGAGGYLGYGSNVGGGFGRSFGNYGGSPGNVMQSSYNQTTSQYDLQYPDLNDAGGGPLLIINPFCLPPELQPPSLLQGPSCDSSSF